MQLLVERVDVRTHGVEVRLRPNWLASLMREVAGSSRPAPIRGLLRRALQPRGQWGIWHIATLSGLSALFTEMRRLDRNTRL